MNKQLITIVCESILEKKVSKDLDGLGVAGYTIWDARGKGETGSRSGDWSENSNIQIQIVCSESAADEISQTLSEKYFEHYAMILYRSPVTVLRSDKF